MRRFRLKARTGAKWRERSSSSFEAELREARSVLRAVWRYDDFRPDQARIVGGVVAGRDTLALVATGAGKSISFQVPGIVRGGVTLVISPLVGLIQDQVAGLVGRGVAAIGLTGPADASTYRRLAFLARREQSLFVYSAPERLKSPRFRAFLEAADVRTIAVDEAHCISQWGHEFRPDYRNITGIRELAPDAVMIAVTATATPAVARDIRKNLRLRSPRVIRGSFDRPNIIFSVFRHDDARSKVLEILEAVPGPSIVYDSTRVGVELWADKLKRAGLTAKGYHGGMDAEQREQVQAQWMRKEARVMVATNAFGMGIDRPDVRSVIHVGLPDSMEAYYQEAGRGGRDGRPAHAVLIASREAIRTRLALSRKRGTRAGGIPESGEDAESPQTVEVNRLKRNRTEAVKRVIPDWRFRAEWRARWRSRARLNPMLRYATSHDCRRRRLVGWFGQRMPRKCDACDSCLGRHKPYSYSRSEAQVLNQMMELAQGGISTRELIRAVPGRSYRNEERMLHLMRQGLLEFEDVLGEWVRVIATPVR